MRASLLISLILVLASANGALAAQPDVGTLVDKAVKALKTTCYEARMNYYAQHANGEEQTVHIYHVAPDLYRVEPLVQDSHGQWTSQGFYYIENAQELLRVVVNQDNEVLYVEELPERSFYLNDALAGKFLRDLARHPGTVVLDGIVDSIEVYQLRQLAFPEKPYTITVGLDKTNYFPVFLLVHDSNQQASVYFKMEAIEYKPVKDLDIKLFQRPNVSAAQTHKAPRIEQLSPSAAVLNSVGEDEDGETRLQVQRAPGKAAAGALAEPLDYALPLYPQYMPAGYFLEGLNLLDYTTMNVAGNIPSLVYQFELFSPTDGRTLSIFLTQSDDFGFKVDQDYNRPDSGYVIQQQGDWLIAVFGDLPMDKLLDIATGLTPNTAEVEELLELTQARDNILQTLNISE